MSSRSTAKSTRLWHASAWRSRCAGRTRRCREAALFDARPDFTYGWRAGVAVAIPVFTRHNAEVQVETARVTQLRAQREARVATLTGEAMAAAARAQAARRQYLRYRDEIVPQLGTIEAMAEDS